MLDFDVIFGIDWLDACFGSIDCKTRVVKFQFHNESITSGREGTQILGVRSFHV